MEEPPINFEVFNKPPPDVMSPQESSEEKKDDDHKEEDELQQLGITGFKKYFLAFLFGLIVISSLVIVYLSMATLVYAFIPTLVNSFVRLVTVFTQVGALEAIFYATVTLEYIPFFYLFVALILKLFFSFFKDIWHNVSPLFLFQNIIYNIKTHDVSYASLALQYTIFALCFIFVDILLIIPETTFQMVGVVIGLFPVIRGIWRVAKHCWQSIFSKKESYVADIATEIAIEMSSTNKLSEHWYTRPLFRLFVRDPNKEIEIPGNLFDPAEVRFMIEWHILIEEPESNAFRSLTEWTWNKVPGIFIIFCILFSLIYHIVTIFDWFHIYDSSFVFSLLTIFFAPFLVIFNFTQPFYKTERFKEKKLLRIIMLVVNILYIVGLVAMIIFFILGAFIPEENVSFTYQTKESLNLEGNYSHPTIPSFCSSKIGEFDILHTAPLLFLPTLFKEHSTEVLNQTNFDVFINYTYDKGQFDLNNYHPYFIGTSLPMYVLVDNRTISTNETEPLNVYLLFGPYKGTQKYAMMVETLFYQYLPSIVGAIVPFFSIVDTFFHAAFVAFSYLVQTATYNAPYTDEVAIRILLNLLKIKENYTSSRPISWNLIGAGISASIAKRVATLPDFYGSFGLLVDGLTPDGSTTEGRNNAVEFTGRRHNIINVRTSSIFSTYKQYFSGNLKIDTNDLFFTTHFSSMCYLMAVCSSDDRYVPLCAQHMDISKYKEIADSFEGNYSDPIVEYR